MTRVDGSVLLVGSVPGDDAEEVMRFCSSELGDRLSAIPDGETNMRRAWINVLAATIYDNNESIETINRPLPIDLDDPEEWRGKDGGWIPRGYTDHWQFQVRDGAELRFDHLGYADFAIESYQVFKKLRKEGMVSADQRYTLFRKGINRNILPVGVEIIVDGYRAKNGTNTMSGRDITFPDGRQLYLEGSAPPQ